MHLPDPKIISYQSRALPEYGDELLLRLYTSLLLPRLVEEKMLLLLRRGEISKWFSGIGQEAISVGATLAMNQDELILPLHRNLGVFTTRQVPLRRLVAQFRGSAAGFTRGRDRSFHFGSLDYNIIGMISHLGPQLAVADGVALAHRLREQSKAVLVFCGEGGTSEGDFHEALNVAAVWNLPVIFLIENNGYGLSTPVEEQYRCNRISERAAGYGMEGISIFGQDLLQVYEQISSLATSIREEPRPVLCESMTFRMRGHEEASGIKYVPDQLTKSWGEYDPIALFENQLVSGDVLSTAQIEQIRRELNQAINQEIDEALLDTPVEFDSRGELSDVFAKVAPLPRVSRLGESRELRFVDAISDGLRESLKRHSELVIMGQDIAEYGGVFKVTEGFVGEFGKDRIRNTPLCESAILGASLGLSSQGIKSVVEMQFSDFISSGFTQVINNLAPVHYRWGMPADVVIRMPCGAGVGAGPFHSQSKESWFLHTPGLKVVYPAFPADAKGLLMASIEDPNPVLFFEHKALYRSLKGQVPQGEFYLPLGEARVVQDGEDISIITYGMGVHWALAIAAEYPQISVHILDLRTLCPLDIEAVKLSASLTGRVLVLHEASKTCGFGAELSALITEHCFSELDAPVRRCASLDTPVPFHPELEKNYLGRSQLGKIFEELLEY